MMELSLKCSYHSCSMSGIVLNEMTITGTDGVQNKLGLCITWLWDIQL